MTVCSEITDYEWLVGDEAARFLNELAAETAPLHTAIARLRAQLSPARTHLVLEQVELRRRAAAKFTDAHRMFFTRTALEQATDQWIAHYKSSRILRRAGSVSDRSPPASFADLCCGIGGDLTALAAIAPTVGIDRDPIAAHLAAANSGATVHTADAAQFDLEGVTAWHVDPDRRSTGRRTTSLETCEPNRAALERLLARVPHAAIKLAPATCVPTDWAERCELEWISRAGACRQQVAWHGNLAQSPGLHRATIISTTTTQRTECSASPERQRRELPQRIGLPRTHTFTGKPNRPIAIARQLDRYIFDIDPAVRAAHLTGTLAAEHNLCALSAGPSYLTGPTPLADPALAAFEVDDVLPLRVRTLASHLRERGIGQLEIKKRGVDTDPEVLRRDLKLRGDNTATLLIAKIAGRPTAILAHRIAPLHDSPHVC